MPQTRYLPTLLVLLITFCYALLLCLPLAPGFIHYDLLSLCKSALRSQINLWHSPYLSLLFAGLLPFTSPLTLLFYVRVLAAALLLTYFVKQLLIPPALRVVFLLLLMLNLPVYALFIDTSRDTLLSLCFTSSVCLLLFAGASRRTTQWNRLSCYGSICAVLLGLAVRPDAILAAVPLVFAAFYERRLSSRPAHARPYRTLSYQLLRSVGLLILVAIAHLGFKYSIATHGSVLSGSSTHTMLHDLVFAAKYRQQPLTLAGLPADCALTASALTSLRYQPQEQTRSMLKQVLSERCIVSVLKSPQTIRNRWVGLIVSDPLAYFRVRVDFLLTILGTNNSLRAYPFSQVYQDSQPIILNLGLRQTFGEEVFDRCVSRVKPPEQDTLAIALLRRIYANTQLPFFKPWFFLLLHTSALLLVLKNGGYRLKEKNATAMRCGLCLSVSAFLLLLTHTFVAPTTSYRYLHWLMFSATLAFPLGLSTLWNYGSVKGARAR